MFGSQLCKHGAISKFCGRCKEEEDVFWDDVDPRVVIDPPIVQKKSYRNYTGDNSGQKMNAGFHSPTVNTYYDAPGTPAGEPTEKDFSVAREMLRVSGISDQPAFTPEEALAKATLIYHTAPRTGGLTLREFEKARKSAPPQAVIDDILDLGDDHSDMGVPPSLATKKVKKKRKKKKIVQFEPPSDPESEPEPEPEPEPELKIFVDEPLDVSFSKYDPFTPESTPTEEKPPEIYHVRGAVVQGSRVLQKIEAPPTQHRVLPIAVNSSADIWRGEKVRIPEVIVVNIKKSENVGQEAQKTTLRLVKGRVKCTCGKLVVREYTPAPSAWLCASCGCEPDQLPHLTTTNPLWGCLTADACRWGICSRCRDIPYLRNGMPVWGTDSFIYNDKFVEQLEDQPVDPPKPKKKKKKKKPASKNTKKPKKKDSSSSSSSGKKRKQVAIVDQKAKSSFTNLVLYSTSDGYWRATTSLIEEQSARVVERGNLPVIERLVNVTIPVESEAPGNKSPMGRPMDCAPIIAMSGMDPNSKTLEAVAVMGGAGIHKRISLTENRKITIPSEDGGEEKVEDRPLTINEAVIEISNMMGLDIIYSFKNPTGACHCGGTAHLQPYRKSACSICDKMRSLLGICQSCGFAKCSECTSRPDFSKHVQIPRNGAFGIGGQYLKAGTNVIAKIDPLIHTEGDVKIGLCVISINGCPVQTSADALTILRERRLEPLPITILFKGKGGTQLTSTETHNGQYPHQIPFGSWLIRGDIPGGSETGISVPPVRTLLDEMLDEGADINIPQGLVVDVSSKAPKGSVAAKPNTIIDDLYPSFDIDELFMPPKQKKNPKKKSSPTPSHDSLGEPVSKKSPKKKPPPPETSATTKDSPDKKKPKKKDSSSSHDSLARKSKLKTKNPKKPPPPDGAPPSTESPKKPKKKVEIK